jgi:integrase
MDAGIRVRGKAGIQIDFTYRGQRCRETLKGLTATKANLEFARQVRATIHLEIAKNIFNYAKHFPESRRVRQFAGKHTVTVSAALDRFLQASRNRCARSTVRDYKSAVEHHLKPEFGDLLVADVTVAGIKAWIGGLSISAKRINNVLVPLRAVMEDAFIDGLIERDPTARIRNLPHRYEEPDPLSPAEIGTFLDACGGQVRGLFQFAIWTGMRTSELIALEWGDIDWVRKVARVRRASVRKYIKVPKTAAGERDVTLLPGALEALEAQKPFSLLANGRIFLNPRTGKPWETDQQIRRTAWQPAIRRSGIRDRNPYQTRHTFASLCLTAGEDVAWVARQLGHKTIAMTLQRYARWIDGIRNSGGEKFSRLLSRPSHTPAASA